MVAMFGAEVVLAWLIKLHLAIDALAANKYA